MATPGICVIGCGGIATSHAKRLRGKAKLWFTSRTRERAEGLNQAVSGEGVFEDLEAALDSADVDAVMITTPPEVHATQAIAALGAGKGVFVEKPVAVSLDEVAQIEEALDEHVLVVGENYYYKPSLQVLRDWILAGEIGTVTKVRVRKCSEQSATGWKAKHGALLEGGIHFVAFLNGLFGMQGVVKAARFPGAQLNRPERHSVVSLSYDNVEAELEYAWDTPSVTKGVFQHSSIEGTDGRIVFESNGIYARLRGRKNRTVFPGLRDLMGAGAMIEDFLDCLTSGRQPLSSLRNLTTQKC